MQTMLCIYRREIKYQDLLHENGMSIATDGPFQENSKVWFLGYIKDAYSEKLSILLQFITAFKRLPAWGIDCFEILT